jgi:hypothetical protein
MTRNAAMLQAEQGNALGECRQLLSSAFFLPF